MKHPQLEIKTRTLGHARVRAEDFLAFESEHLEGVDFCNRKLKGLSANSSRFVSCRFENMRVETASFGVGQAVSEYVNCSFDGLRFNTAFSGYSRFERCSFRNVDLRNWFCF